LNKNIEKPPIKITIYGSENNLNFMTNLFDELMLNNMDKNSVLPLNNVYLLLRSMKGCYLVFFFKNVEKIYLWS